MLTAAVRDLHYWYPGKFMTDVRTSCLPLWENNPHLSRLAEDDPEVEQIECSYPLINRCDQTPYHCLHGFIEFLNDRLNLAIKPTAFKGDLHLSAQEKLWHSQVHEVTGQDTPFWIVAAGGKYDVTIKWWESRRYQEVVNHFRGRIQFVQVGERGHHHPKLAGVIDFRGQTNLRELVRLVYHSQGVLCSVTALMHLAAAVETKRPSPPLRPCVVIAGGREPAHWEAYPQHHFIHTNGALPCCTTSGCWKDRTTRLRDGDQRDGPDYLCTNVVNQLPRCMDMIGSAEVIRRIETYFAAGVHHYLTVAQRVDAERGISATSNNDYEEQPLVLASAGMACDQFAKEINAYPGGYEGRGIVICAGGVRYFTAAWVCIKMLRRLGCRLAIQLWHLGPKEMTPAMKALVEPLGVECVDARKIRKKHPARLLRGWPLKPYAIIHSPFREVLFLDADNVPVVNPEFLFDIPEFKCTGAVFWPDYNRKPTEKTKAIWRSCGLHQPGEPEFESGQILVDKERCWKALQLTLWFNENADFYYQYVHGDKETFHLAFRKLRKSYRLVPKRIHPLPATMCQHDFQGRRIFQHRNLDKWDLLLHNRRVPDFWFEDECRAYVAELRERWDGEARSLSRQFHPSLRKPTRHAKPMRIQAVVISPAESREACQRTLKNLARTDWGEAPVVIETGNATGPEDSLRDRWRESLRGMYDGLVHNFDHVLFLTADLEINCHLRHNLEQWSPLKSGQITLAGLFNPGVRELACDMHNNIRAVEPKSVFGQPVFLLAREATRQLLRQWREVQSTPEVTFASLTSHRRKPIPYHAPSLVQPLNTGSERQPRVHRAIDFDAAWKA